MHHRKHLYVIMGLVILGCLLLLTTNPERMPLPVLILPFIIIFILLWLILRIVLRYFYPGLTKSKMRVFAALLAAFPVVCLLLQSVGQFSSRDFITLSALIVVLWFYLNRAITA